MDFEVDVYCLFINEEVRDDYGIADSKVGYFSYDDGSFRVCEDLLDESVIKTFSKAKMNEWVKKCQQYVDDMNIQNVTFIKNYNIQHNIKFSIRRKKVPLKLIKKQLKF